MTLERLEHDSGLTAYIDHMPDAYTNTIEVVVGYSSVQERRVDEGVAHALEHGVMTQTRSFASREEVRDFIHLEGVRANANTDYQRTLHTTSGDNPDVALRHLGEVLTGPTFDADIIKEEMRTIRQEARDKLASFNVTDPVAVDFAMFGLPAGRRTMGRVSQLYFGAEALRAAHRRNYGLANMSLVAVGAVTAEQVLSGIDRYFEDIYPNAQPDLPALPQANTSPRSTGLVNPSAKSTVFSQSFPMNENLSIAYREDPLAFEVAARALREACFRRLRFERNAVYDAGVDLRTGNYPGYWSIRAQATADVEKLPIAREVFRGLFGGGAAGLGEKALIMAQKIGTSLFLRTLHSPEDRAGNYSERLGYRARPEDPAQSAERLRSMTLHEVKKYVDTLCEHVVSIPAFEHITGTRQDIGQVDQIIKIGQIG